MLWHHISPQSALGFLTVLYCLGLTPTNDVPKYEAWDVLIDFDVRYGLCMPKDVYAPWTSEVEWARNAYDTAKKNNYPPLSMLNAFPSKEVIDSKLSFGRSYYRLHTYNYSDYYKEYTNLLGPWESLYCAHTVIWSIHKRQWLADLRKKIGNSAFYAGVMPPAVPIWKFKEVRDEDPVSDPAVRRALYLLCPKHPPR